MKTESWSHHISDPLESDTPILDCSGFDGANNRLVHDKRLDGLSTSDSSFHPSDKGYVKYFEAIKDNLGL